MVVVFFSGLLLPLFATTFLGIDRDEPVESLLTQIIEQSCV
jgi:hypothetical protein